MEVNIPKPTLIKLPADIKRIVLVDKTKGDAISVLEGVLTGEMLGIDKSLAQECIAGIVSPLLRNGKIVIVRHNERLMSESAISKSFGKMMNWSQVDSISSTNNADALLVLEFFDSDYTVRNQMNPRNVGPFLFQGFIDVKAGVRIYLPKTRELFYENKFSFSNFYGETAVNKSQLLSKLTFGTDALKYGSYQLGNRIGKKFVSYYTWEDRFIYKGNTRLTKQAERYIIAQDYDNAIQILEKEYYIENQEKLKSQIAHNIGYCYEVKGNLINSKKWLSESYVLSGNSKTQQYLNIINDRIGEELILERENKIITEFN